MDLFQIDYDPKLQRYTVRPISGLDTDKYLVEFKTKESAIFALPTIEQNPPTTSPEKYAKPVKYNGSDILAYKLLK